MEGLARRLEAGSAGWKPPRGGNEPGGRNSSGHLEAEGGCGGWPARNEGGAMRQRVKCTGLVIGLLLLSFAAAWVVVGQPFIPGRQLIITPAEFTKTVTLRDSLISTKACTTGYKRIWPNFCQRESVLNAFIWVDAIPCTAVTVSPALPADAKAIALSWGWRVLSNNIVGNRSNTVTFYHDPACTQAKSAKFSQVTVREEVAVVAGTVLAIIPDPAIVPVTAISTISVTQANAGGNGNADIDLPLVEGYYD